MDKAKPENKSGTKVGIQPAGKEKNASKATDDAQLRDSLQVDKAPVSKRTEIGGRKGPEPTRYGDWEKNGRCIDF